MTKEELLAELKRCSESTDLEVAHGDADTALLAYIDDLDVTLAFGSWDKWYA